MGMIGNSLAQGLISGANIQDGTVDTPDIKDSAVTAAKIASAVVTPAKMDFSAGTANGVLFLNGSKVASSGSGLTLDSSSNLSLLGTFTIGNAGVASGIINSADSLFFNIDSDNNDGTNANFFAWGRDATTTSATRLMTLNAIGYLAIGDQTSPTTRVDIRGTSANVASTVQIVGTGVSTLLLGQNSDGGVVRGQGGNNCLTFWTGGAGDTAAGGSGTERARIDSGGNFGIGSAPISSRLTVKGDWVSGHATVKALPATSFAGGGLAGYGIFDSDGTTRKFYLAATANDSQIWGEHNAPMVFATNNIERFRIDASGYTLVGGTSSVGSPVGRLQVWENSNSNSYVAIDVRSVQASSTAGTRGCTTTIIEGSGGNSGSSGNVAIKFHHNDYNNLSGHLSFWTKNDSNTQLQRLTVGHDGTITFNAYGSGSLSTNASGVVLASDGRFKVKTRGIQNALDAVVQLGQLATFYRWDEHSPWHTEYEELGWFAQDVASIIPEASPEPESPLEIGEDGKPYTLRYKNYQDRAILAYMAKAIEELKAEFDAYKEAHP